MDRRKGREHQREPNKPEEKMRPLIEEDLARFDAHAAPPPRRLDKKPHRRLPRAAEKHQIGKSPREEEDGLIDGVASSSSPLRLRLQPLEYHDEDERHQAAPDLAREVR
jgi:hypothetical protein